MSTLLKGKVALITGASRGIGAAIARAYAAQGADLALSFGSSSTRAESLAAELEASGIKVKTFQADQADASQVDSLVQSAANHFGRLDILVNNAGVFYGGAVGDPDADLSALDRQLAINYVAVVAGTRAAALRMGEGGRIITIGSVLGERVPFPGIADYAATKAAVVGFTRGAARDLAARNITVNVIQPGSTATEMNPEDGPTSDGQRALIALGRYGKPEDVAEAAVFLASPAASYITGSVISVDGGFLA